MNKSNFTQVHIGDEAGTPRQETAKLPGDKVIESYLPMVKKLPGVYRMIDKNGTVLYVGKARNLRQRISAYTKLHRHTMRIKRMIASTAAMMFLTTETETDALLLEQNLIKHYKPKYNVLLRDGKSFPHIQLTHKHRFPQITKHRGRKRKDAQYYGPFASAAAVDYTLQHLQKIFLLRTCSDNVFAMRTRPCLQYQIARCSAPCVGKISQNNYAQMIAEARQFLLGKTSHIQRRLAKQMTQASNALQFERAAALRDRIRALTFVQSKHDINPKTVTNADIIALAEKENQACIQIFLIRGNQNRGNRGYFPQTGTGAASDEILEGFIAQFYRNNTPPPTIIVSDTVRNKQLLQFMLHKKYNQRINIIRPLRGEKIELIVHALRNARHLLEQRIAQNLAQDKILQALMQVLNLAAPPKRIEVYDNSHIQGSHAVGAMIVAGVNGFIKSAYRKFNINRYKVANGGNDIAMMRHVLNRRFKRLLKDSKAVNENWPDLLLIDGGIAQVTAVAKVLKHLNITNITILGVAKGINRNAGHESFYRPDGHCFCLKPNDPVLYFIQRLRDEAHRFAIGAHRHKRTKAITKNSLDNIAGIGAVRKKILLAHFGSAKAVSDASLKELKVIKGISNTLAETIYYAFCTKN